MESETMMRKAGSLELPQREPPIRKGRTIVVMLHQAYFKNDDDDSSAGDNGKPDFNRLAYPTTSPPHNNMAYNTLVESSPASTRRLARLLQSEWYQSKPC